MHQLSPAASSHLTRILVRERRAGRSVGAMIRKLQKSRVLDSGDKVAQVIADSVMKLDFRPVNEHVKQKIELNRRINAVEREKVKNVRLAALLLKSHEKARPLSRFEIEAPSRED